MKIAVIGSRRISVSETELNKHLAKADEIVSGGAKGVDRCASDYAKKNGIKLTEFPPNYERYGRAAPIIRNKAIVDYADLIVAFWDGSSKGTRSVIQYAGKIKKPCCIILATDTAK